MSIDKDVIYLYVAKRHLTGVFALLTLSACAHVAETVPAKPEHITAGIFLENPESRHLLQALAPPPKLVQEGLELTEDSEGWEPSRYDDVAGYCTIGFGHLIKKSNCNGTGPENPEFLNAISRDKGAEILSKDLWTAQRVVARLVRKDLDPYQFAALTDFVFNVGGANFEHSTLLRVINEGKFDQVGDQLKRWIYAGNRPVQGLEARRLREAKLFYFRTPHLLRVVAPLPPIDIRVGESANQ